MQDCESLSWSTNRWFSPLGRYIFCENTCASRAIIIPRSRAETEEAGTNDVVCIQVILGIVLQLT